MKRTEYLLYGFIDLFNIKLKLDKYILKNTKNINYNQLKITNNDIKDYYELEDVIKTTIGKIETNIKKLNKTCNDKSVNIQDDLDAVLLKIQQLTPQNNPHQDYINHKTNNNILILEDEIRLYDNYSPNNDISSDSNHADINYRKYLNKYDDNHDL